MEESQQPINLNTNAVDYIVSALKAVSEAIPFAGPLFSELIQITIPNQRGDRLAKFCMVLEKKWKELDQDFIRSQLTNENFVDLLEEGIIQTVRSVTDERREYIATLIQNSLSSEDIDYIESKYLLSILGQINDIEVIMLRDHINQAPADWELREKHDHVLLPIRTTKASDQKDIDKRTLWESHRDHLHRLKLLDPVYEMDSLTGQPKFDNYTGRMTIRRYELTKLGNLLLRHLLIEKNHRDDGGNGSRPE